MIAFNGASLDKAALKSATEAFSKKMHDALVAAGYPPAAEPARINYPMLVASARYW